MPFALFSGWLTVATIAATAVWLYSTGWRGGALGEVTWTIVMILVAFFVALYVGFRLKNIVYVLVVTWATFAIWVERKEDFLLIANTALAVAVILFVCSVIVGWKLLYKKSF